MVTYLDSADVNPMNSNEYINVVNIVPSVQENLT